MRNFLPLHLIPLLHLWCCKASEPRPPSVSGGSAPQHSHRSLGNETMRGKLQADGKEDQDNSLRRSPSKRVTTLVSPDSVENGPLEAKTRNFATFFASCLNYEYLPPKEQRVIDAIFPLGERSCQKKLTQLRESQSLDLSNNRLQTITPLAFLPIKHLYLGFNWLSDVETLASIPQLQTLDLSYNQDLANIATIAELKKIRTLSLNSTSIMTLRPLKQLVTLEDLDLSSIPARDWFELRSLTNLFALYLNSNQIEQLTFLAELSNLRILDLGFNVIKDIDELSKHRHIEVLNLQGNRIEDIAAIANLSSLRELDVSDNPVKSFDPLKALAKLQKLSIGSVSGSKLNSLGMLSNPKNIRYLKLKHCSSPSASMFKNFVGLKELILERCDNKMSESDYRTIINSVAGVKITEL